MDKLSIEDMAVFCKRKGFVYPSSEIYGGFSGFWDFGHLGVELKNNIKAEWWKYHVAQRNDVVGMDGSIITHPKVWQASGHVENFEDVMLTCSKCKEKVRADQFIEEKLKINVEGFDTGKITEVIKKNKLKCPKCGSDFEDIKKFNLMFQTNVGPTSGSAAYLRPETAQLIFSDFKLIAENARLKLPFGIAQIGKGFRNEISPRDFLFRCREFDMMELEYFVHPDKVVECPFVKEVENYELNFLSQEIQKTGNPKKMKVKDAIKKKLISEWIAYWLATEQKWFTNLGANPDNFRVRQHLKEEKSHYAADTWDLEYNFPFGWKELQGIANRTDFDLKQHMKFSGKDMSLFDEETKKKIIPHVIAEPSLGAERAFLVFMFDAYNDDKKRGNVVLKLNPKLAPVKVAIFPLVSNKPIIVKKAKEVYNNLKIFFNVFYDASGSIGRRYARQDEVGTPLCITIDFDSIKKDDVTIRERDSTKQIRVKIKDLGHRVWEYMVGAKFEKLGKTILK
jgi:glycyl-tRNA synthetase|tara:strand:- start:665 stop:2188 length:1524 start_codon:yes stop_codon:yes gene_type:complete